MRDLKIGIAIIIVLVMALYVFPILASAQTCGSYTGSNWGCYVSVEVVNNATGKPIKGVQITSPALICTTGADGKCTGSRSSGTFNFYAKKAHYADNYCLALSCTNRVWNWGKIRKDFNGQMPTIFDNGGYTNHTVDWDRGDSDAQWMTINFIIPAKPSCTGTIPSQTIYLDTVYIASSASGTFTLSNPPLNQEGTLEIWLDDLYNQAPGRTVFQ